MTAPVPTQVPRADVKLATRVADQIIDDIAGAGWPVGAVLGGEPELLGRYDVSRAVFREAVRLLEHLGVATTRRGPGGGLVVTAPSSAAVMQACLVYLTRAGMTLGELMAARASLERSAARLAAERADEHDIAALRTRVTEDGRREQLDAADHHVLHTMVGAASRNAAAELFVDVLGRLTARWSYPSTDADAQRRALAASAQAHAAIVDAITSGDAALSERRTTTHMRALGDWLGTHRTSPRSLDWVLDHDADEKLGSQVARAVIVDIVDREWPVGEVIGSERDLLERYDVSRAALREAVRLLEYHQIAAMKRGPGGGLVVLAPSIDPIVRAATVFLRSRRITPTDLLAVRRDLESDAVVLAAERATDDELTALHVTLATDSAAGFEAPSGEDLHVRIATLAGNPAITLFVRVLVELTRVHTAIPGRRSRRRASINAETASAHDAIVEALDRRDPSLARRRMLKHLVAMEPALR